MKKRQLFVLIALLFALYTFIISRPVPTETVLVMQQLNSLESNYIFEAAGSIPASNLVPFELGNRFGYLDAESHFTVNQIKKAYLSQSTKYWADYDAVPEAIEVMDPFGDTVCRITTKVGYPVFLDGRIFLIAKEQNSISAVNEDGSIRWSYDFATTLTTIDARNGIVAAGLLDGAVEVLNDEGKQLFFYKPGGSRLEVILGCALSHDASKLAIISGIDQQRFLLLEWAGDTYQVNYHEFLGEGLRRAVYISFIDNDSHVIFEKNDRLIIYNVSSRSSTSVLLPGKIIELEESGTDHYLFLITANDDKKHFVALRLPGMVIFEAPFTSEHSFLARRDSRLFIGGGSTMATFEIESM
ncbi:hypothetical protein FACS1894164_17410 [Spirochaetia bacterium]|nr:hypothetical protein FACS1894164_17410 [Spirochaetia bacterium]